MVSTKKIRKKKEKRKQIGNAIGINMRRNQGKPKIFKTIINSEEEMWQLSMLCISDSNTVSKLTLS